MNLYRELNLLSRLLILCGGFNVQFGLVFFSVGVGMAALFLNLMPRQSGLDYLSFIAPITFIIAGGVISGIGFKKNMKDIQLLQYGVMTTGRLKEKNYTNVTINKIPEMIFGFEFGANNGRKHIAYGRTHEHHLVQDDREERIIYHPDNPDFSIVYDLVPNAPVINGDGSLQPVSIIRIYLFILPLITIVALYFFFNAF